MASDGPSGKILAAHGRALDWRVAVLLARAPGDDTGHRDYRDRYRAMATSLGFEGHMKWAEAMP